MTGYIDLILLARWAVSLQDVNVEKGQSSRLLAVLGGVAVLCAAWSFAAENARLLFVLGAAVGMFVLLASFILFRYKDQDAQLCLLSIAVFVAVSGACVNPLQVGAYTLTSGPSATAITQANDEGDLWIADNSTLGDLCVARGASCINSVNTYPTLSTWHKIDEVGEYEQVYNRYAHITVEPTDAEATFELTAPDAFKLKLNLDDARKLGATKWITLDDLTQFETDSVRAVEVSAAGNYKIYQLVDKN